ncbi:NfuA family Fe-S biogenesis protein [Oleiagrimonas soli]|uniref:Fe/S biogenesis protein NfuA n=1 Tax=Oleiagrimonas soli TaxID=1543381 RepID=A0A099CW84_9GAMM|nr:NfuA family Fe-S biogenesis protein [Oleiagrimonas soli]KGI78233.1 Fe/S biogenesis protein NfuA [Oleiagrimonas soli]MBB6183301.1 Fe/S biogenesis protein NfuA [Oleiagrimonas soli]
MIEISERAQDHFRKLIAQQQIDGLGIRLHVAQGGTPAANCELEFCERDELQGNEWTIECHGFEIHVDGDSVSWLEGASIDFEPNATGGLLNIRAPKIKGEVPGVEAGIVERVRYVIEATINPQIASHGGRVSLLEVTADGVVVLQFGGGCHGCGMADVTLKQGIEKTLRQQVPEITAVRDATDHSSGQHPFYEGKQGASAVS